MNLQDQAIVLKTLKYGDTNMICHLFARNTGVLSFIVKGILGGRSKNRKANLLQPGTLLDIVFDKHPNRSLQYLKDFQLAAVPQHHESVIKNCIRIFFVEALAQLALDESLEQQPLYDFYVDTLAAIQEMDDHRLANAPLFFIIHAAELAGYAVHNNFQQESAPFFHLTQGNFSRQADEFSQLDAEDSRILAEILQQKNLPEALDITMNNTSRRLILQQYLAFLEFHTGTFQTLKCLPILQVILA